MNQLRMRGTKWQIFKCALYLYAERSYNVVSMRDLADEVGIAPPSIYNHFESKEALLLKIYEFFEYHIKNTMADVDELLADAETKHPYVVLRKSINVFPDDLRPLIARAMVITTDLVRMDLRAEQLVEENLIEASKKCLRPVLNKMIDLGKIEPMDVESFLLIYSSYQHSAAVQFFTEHMIEAGEWIKGFDLMFQLVKVKE